MMYSGSEFQMEEAAAGKTRLPTVDSLTDGTMRQTRFIQPGLCGDDPLATVTLPQRSLSSQSLGKY